MNPRRRAPRGAALIALAALLGCAGAEPAPEPAPGQSADDLEQPNDHDAPPLGNPRPKKLPGDVLDEEE